MKYRENLKGRLAVLRIVGIYIFVAAVWIYWSDTLMEKLTRDPDIMTRIAVLKGFIFIIITGTLLYHLISRYLRNVSAIEKELRESRNLMNTLIEETTDLIYVKDVNGRYLLINTSALNFAGKSSVETLGKDDKAILSVEEAELIMKSDRQVMNSGKVLTVEESATGGDGKNRIFHATKGPIYDTGGRIAGLFGISRDITEHRKAEEYLRLNEERLKLAIAASKIGVWEWDIQTNDVLWSPECYKIYGVSPDKISFETYLSLVCPEDRLIISEMIDNAISSRAVQTVEYRIVRPNGKQIWILDVGQVLFDGNGTPGRMIGIIQDITERKRSEDELRKSEERYRKLLASVTDYVFTVEMEGRTPGRMIHTPACLAITGYTPDEFEKNPNLWYTMIHPDDRALMENHLQISLSGEGVTHCEHRIIRKDGSVRWVKDTRVVRNDSVTGKIVYDGMISDITEKKYTELQLSQLNECFLSFGADPVENIAMLVTFCGEQLGATTALYNRFDGGRLIPVGRWHAPEDLDMGTSAEGHVCYDVVRKKGGEATLIRNLPETNYAKTDSLVLQYGLQTYLGKGVPGEDGILGSLCVVYTRDFIPSDADLKIISIVTSAISVEEKRRKAEDALAEREHRYRTLFNLSPNAILLEDQNGIILEANDALCTSYNYRGKDLAGRHVEILVPPEGRSEINSNIQQILDGNILDHEVDNISSDGILHRMELREKAIPLPGGRKGILVVANDITGRKKADERVRMLAHTIESISEAVSITDLNNSILYVNKAFCTIYGYREEELISKSIEIVRSPNDNITTTPLILEGTRSGGWAGELLNRRKDGSDFPVSLSTSVVYDERGRAIALVGVAQDISVRRQSESELRQTRDHLQRLLDSSPAVIYSLAPGSGYPATYVSENLKSQFGYEAREVLADPGFWTDRIHPEDRETVLLDQKNLAGLGQLIQEYRFLAKNNEYRWIRDQRRLVIDERGKPVETVGFWVDIHETKILEKQFLRAQRMESIGTLAGGIAHDLNNVLSPIMMGIGILGHQHTDPESKEILEMLSASVKRGSEMIKQVLSFARGVGGEHRPLQFKPLLEELLKILRETFPKSIDFLIDVPGDLWLLSGDPTQLHQVLINLCVNARDAMPDGGRIEICAANMFADEHFARTHIDAKEGTYVLVTVSDTGPGIHPGIIDKIFDPFFTTKEVGKGTGLGLSTVLSIVRSHGGFITVTSENGRGTIFNIYLPALATEELEAAVSRSPSMSRGDGSTILVVEDEMAVREMTRTMLETFGYTVLTARDGSEAVAVYAARANDIALVITDMMMPTTGGSALIAALQKLNPAVRLIAVSGLALGESVSPDAAGKRIPFLLKPYTSEKLLALVKETLSS